MNVDKIEGVVLSVEEDSEPWEYYSKTTQKEVTGWLRDAVLRRTGLTGVVTSSERHYSSGTCELCGASSEGIRIFVDGVEVYAHKESGDLYGDDYPNPFVKLGKWLEGVDR